MTIWRHPLWAPACLVCLAWALWATWKIPSSSDGPAPVAAMAAFGSDHEAVAELERLMFLRQFAEQDLNHDESSFWQKQTALAFLMSEDKRAERLHQLEERRERRSKENFRQRAEIDGIEVTGEGPARVVGRLEGRQGNSTWKLGFSLRMQLAPIPRTLENSWGLVVTDLDLKTAPSIAPAAPGPLRLRKGSPTVVAFLCQVENVEAPADLPVRIKITSLQVSEIQFLRSADWEGERALKARCGNRLFPLILKSVVASETRDLFRSWPESASEPDPRTIRARAKNAPYQRTLEQELGFVIEE